MEETYINQENIEDIYPMSDIEKGMVFHTLLDPSKQVYLRQNIFIIQDDDFDEAFFKKAFLLMVEKHPILRTGFNMFDYEEPIQIVYVKIPLDIIHYDISQKDKTGQEEYINRLLTDTRKGSFDMADGEPLWKIRTFNLGKGHIGIMWMAHHAIIDGWSTSTLITEFNNTYLKLKKNPDYMPEKLKNTYKAFVVEQMIEKKKPELIEFWRKELQGYKKIDFSTFTRKAKKSEGIKRYSYYLNKQVFRKLQITARQFDTSVKNLCFAAYFYMVSMLTYDNDTIVGLVSNNRPLCPDGGKIVGCFLNTVPFRINIPDKIKWADYIYLIEEKNRVLKQYDRISFLEILRGIGESSKNGNRLFDTTFNFTDFYIYNELEKGLMIDRNLSDIPVDGYETSNITFDFVVRVLSDELEFSVSYDRASLEDYFVQNACRYFENILHEFVFEPGTIAIKDKVIAAEEKYKLLHLFNDTCREYDKDKKQIELFEEKARKLPDYIALSYRDNVLTYKELKKQALCLAGLLESRGVESADIIGIMTERSIELIVGILGVLKAGAAYLPIDPQYPLQRVRYMLADSGAELILTDRKKNTSKLKCNAASINLHDPKNYKFEPVSRQKPGTSLNPAYVIYTSGSTGKPKGVIIKDRAVVNFINGITDEIDFSEADSILSLTTQSFDIFVLETLLPLLKGSKIVMGSSEEQTNPAAAALSIKKESITILQVTPSRLQLIVSNPESCDSIKMLKYLLVGGEALSENLLERVRHIRDGKIYNLYGPTETTIWSTLKDVSAGEELNIGKPIANTDIYILSKTFSLQPLCVPGELCIAGDGLSIGYLNIPGLTDEKFVNYPPAPSGRIYRTGDLARWLPDGNIEFIGRIDELIKIRGFRIELGEIENQLQKHSEIKEAVVVIKDNKKGDNVLCAYFVSGNKTSAAELREYLSKFLPDYMIPWHFEQIQKIPLTPNGKINRKALPGPTFLSGKEYRPPGNETEKVLIEIWHEILNMDRQHIGIDSNFFELGGHSLSATQLMSKMQKKFNVKIPLAEVFRIPTIKELALCIKEEKIDRYISIRPTEKKEYYKLSAAQKRLYILQHIEGRNTSYNIPYVIPAAGTLSSHEIEQAFKELVARHESLRTSFDMLSEEPVQIVHEDVNLKIKFYQGNGKANRHIIKKFTRPFDLKQVPLIRVGILSNKDSRSALLVDMHHIITDATSQNLLITEFMEILSGRELPKLRMDYKDFAEWQDGYEQQKWIKKQEAFWLETFSREISILQLPADYLRPPLQSFTGCTVTFPLDEKVTLKLREIGEETQTTLYMIILAVFNILLSKLSGQEDITVGTPVAARRHPDLESVVGMFVNTLAMRSDIARDKTFKEVLEDVKKRTLNAFENQEYPFEDLVDKVSIRRDPSRNPIFDVMFNFLDQRDYSNDTAVISEQEPVFYKHRESTSKFDLNLTAADMGKYLLFDLEYSTKLFKPATIERFIEYFRYIISQISLNFNTGLMIKNIHILTESGKKGILDISGGGKLIYDKDLKIDQLFEKQAKEKPDEVAIVYDGRNLSYGFLNLKSNKLAAFLRKKGVRPDTIVGLMVSPSFEMVVGMLGILKAGGAYLPIDPEYPEERKNYMLKDSRLELLLTDECPPIIGAGNIETINLKDENVYCNNPVKSDPARRSSDIVYIIYTSGSTGKPKGVMLEHNNLVNLLRFQGANTNIDFTRILQFTTISFDVSFQEIFSSLVSGGTLFLLKREIKTNIPQLFQFIKRNDIKTLFLPASFLKFVFNEVHYSEIFPAAVTHIVTAGEQVIINDQFREFLCKNHVFLHNHYGPSETHVVTTFTIEPTGFIPETPSIGRAISNTMIYILDPENHLVPEGIAGQLCVSGDQVGRGYLGRMYLTKEKFTANPFIAGERLYKTGDLVRRMPDSNIEFLGRMDHQVKIRGFRIEPGEIENRLCRKKEVKEAIVLVKDDGAGDISLYAYLVLARELPMSELKRYLSEHLPEYMIPAHFAVIDKIPLTPNGKIDRNALPEVRIEAGQEYIAPRNIIEWRLAETWSKVLGIRKEAIGIKDNFFDLGGHSLKATIMAAKIHKELNVEITLAEIFKTPTISGLSKFIKQSEVNTYVSVEPAEKKEYYLLSSAQKRLFVLQQFDIKNTGYNLPQVIEVKGTIVKDRLEKIFRKLIKRHESLRTSFVIVNHQPVQKIHDEVVFEVEYFDIAPQTTAVPGDVFNDFVRPFDLSHTHLLRVRLIKTGDEKYVLLMDMHHIITDNMSQEILVKEFRLLDSGHALPATKLQYKDYSEWQKTKENRDIIKKQETYWLRKFKGEIPVLNLPADYVRPAIRSFAGKSLTFDLSAVKTQALRKIAVEENITMYMLLLALFDIFLFKISSQKDIVIGTPAAGRRNADMEEIVGMFVNTLALRNYIQEEKRIKEFLTEVKEETLASFNNQEYQFEDLVNKIQVNKDPSRNPLFEVMFSYQIFDKKEETGPEITKKEFNPDHYDIEKTVSKFDLTFYATDTREMLIFTVEYCTKLFRESTVADFVNYFKRIVSFIINNNKEKIADIEIISEKERKEILFDFNRTDAAFLKDKTVQELFEVQVNRLPDCSALIYENSFLTYRESSTRVNRLAGKLRGKGVIRERIIGIMAKRSLEMIIGIFAIIKAGGAYLPIDPEYPAERILFMMKDSEIPLLLTHRQTNSENYNVCDCEVMKLEDPTLYKSNSENTETINTARDLLYAIYTSGSTGQPKGVLVEHRSVINRLNWMQKKYPLTENDVILQKTPITFDVSVWELFWWSLFGAKLCLLKPGGEKNPAVIMAAVNKEAVTIMHFVPAMLYSFLEYVEISGEYRKLHSLKRIFSSGEKLAGHHVESFFKTVHKNGTQLSNLYGPTEATVDVSYFDCVYKEQLPDIPIGKPIDNTKLYIVSSNRCLLPVGIVGELCIAGVGLARGYLKRPELTAEKFVKNPFDAGSRMYKSGDLTKWLPDGNIEYIGRIDEQVKIRGFRIELGEIENQLLKHDDIKKTVVITKKAPKGDNYLLAYYESNGEPPEQELRQFLSKFLPHYMIPAYFIRLAKLPLTPNGKVKIKALHLPEISKEDSFIAPNDHVEEKVRGIWSNILGIKKDVIGVNVNFFELGGHSINAISMISNIHKEFNLKLPLSKVFTTPTIKELSNYIKEMAEFDIHQPINPVEKKEYYPLSSAQKRLYFIQQMDLSATVYNMSEIMYLKGKPSKNKLENVCRELIKRHDSLRTSFAVVNNQPVQIINERVDFKLDSHNTGNRTSSKDNPEKNVNKFIRAFDLSQAPLFRMNLIRFGENNYMLIADLHHIVSDGISNEILKHDFKTLYDGEELQPLKLQYKDFSEWQDRQKEDENLKHQEAFWLKEFEGEIPKLNLIGDFERPEHQDFQGDGFHFDLKYSEIEELKNIASEEEVTLFMVLLGLYNIFLAKISNQEDVVTGTPITGRSHIDLENIIGMFTNTLAIRNYPHPEKTFTEFLKDLKGRVVRAYENQDYQFDDLVEKLNLQRDYGSNPLFDVGFVFYNNKGRPQEVETEDMVELTGVEDELGKNTAKFDLSLYVTENNKGMAFTIEYNTNLFEKATVEKFSRYFKNVVGCIILNKNIKLKDIKIFTNLRYAKVKRRHIEFGF